MADKRVRITITGGPYRLVSTGASPSLILTRGVPAEVSAEAAAAFEERIGSKALPDLEKTHVRFEEVAPEEGEPNADSLEGVDFASGAAEEAATEAGLTTEDFEGVDQSGEGGYTKADVEGIIDGLEEDPGEDE